MSVESDPKEDSPFIDDVSEERAVQQDRSLLNGPVTDLCEFFGLSARAIVTLHKLDVIVGADVASVNMCKVHLLAGEKTARRIGLLKEWCRLRIKEIGDSGPSSEAESTEVKNAER